MSVRHPTASNNMFTSNAGEIAEQLNYISGLQCNVSYNGACSSIRSMHMLLQLHHTSVSALQNKACKSTQSAEQMLWDAVVNRSQFSFSTLSDTDLPKIIRYLYQRP